eukprot:XP_001698051.1 predicted protein [Chlamydomonas reinhardtii]
MRSAQLRSSAPAQGSGVRRSSSAGRRPVRHNVACNAAKKSDDSFLSTFIRKGAVAGLAGVLLGTAQFGGGYAEAAPSLTATQNAKAEELARIVRERTGQDLPRVEASPSADAELEEARAAAERAVTSGNSSALKEQLRVLNDQLRREQEESSPLGFVGALGIVVGGGLAGYVAVLNQSKEKTEEELTSTIAVERKAVAELKAKAADAAAALERERNLVARLQGEMKAAANDSARLLELEKVEKEAARRSATLTEESLAVEKKLVEAMSQLTASMDEEAARRGEAEELAEELQQRLSAAGEKMAQQEDMLSKVGKEALSMKSAMKVLKEQALAISVSAQKDAAAAREEREKVEAQLAAEERDAATQARSEQSRLKAALVESQARAAGLEAELEQAKAANTGLQAQVKALQGTVVGLEDQLAQSSSSNAALSQQASGLRSELADVRKALGATQVQEAYNRDVGAARSRISGLEGELAAQRASNAELERQLSARLSQVSAQLTQAEEAAKAAKTERDSALVSAAQQLQGVSRSDDYRKEAETAVTQLREQYEALKVKAAPQAEAPAPAHAEAPQAEEAKAAEEVKTEEAAPKEPAMASAAAAGGSGSAAGFGGAGKKKKSTKKN